MEKIEEKYGSCHGCQLAGVRHCAHADTCGNAKEYPMSLRTMVIHSHADNMPLSIVSEKSYDMGYTTRNDEVVELLQEAIDYHNDLAGGCLHPDHESKFKYTAMELTTLLQTIKK